MYCTQEYKGYFGHSDWSEDDQVCHGRLLYIQDIVTYEADDWDGVQAAFEESVDHYLQLCEEQYMEADAPNPKGFLKIEDAPRDGTHIWVVRPHDLKLFEAWFHADGMSLLATGPEKTGTWHCEEGGWFEKGEVHYWLPNEQPTEGYVVKWGDTVKHTKLVDSDNASMAFYFEPNYSSIGVTSVFPNN